MANLQLVAKELFKEVKNDIVMDALVTMAFRFHSQLIAYNVY
ncbi:hypothetical protein [Peribacillus simplex]|nr:hypothetical protein [Peribacillus simplex]MDR4926345.1 hypothetical protein [Peribacillus simplex]WHX89040.1 hypothetical protein QNH50_13120 [Peribacillus simplex]